MSERISINDLAKSAVSNLTFATNDQIEAIINELNKNFTKITDESILEIAKNYGIAIKPNK